MLACASTATAQADEHRELARELARVVTGRSQPGALEDTIGAGMTQAMAARLEQRLNRRLLDVEWQMLTGIVRRFVADAITPSRTEEIAADVYLRHFDAEELRDLLRFERSPVGRKAARLGPVIARETAEAVEQEIRTSAGAPRLVEDLRRAFPVFGGPESP
jgi:hypothetical protein